MSDYAVILAGGKGERFWPLSTTRRPKQFLSLVGDRSLLAQAVDRLHGLIPPERVFVITNQDLVAAAIEAAPDLPPANIIGEPVGRDTAAAVALGAALVKARDPQAAFAVLTADHVMGDLDCFRATLRESLALARRQDVLITIGIPPTEPSTAYGYIETGAALGEHGGVPFLKAKRFVEKPPLDQARAYVEAGTYCWNSGMFIWSVAAVERAFAAHRPALAGLLNRLADADRHGQLVAALATEYPALEKISIDYALMEKASNIVMARGLFRWDDVGSWTALENHFPKDAAGNVVVGDAHVLGGAGNIVYSRGQLTAVIGLDNVIVVQAAGVTLVCAKDRAQDIKKLLEQVRATGRHQDVL